MPDSPPFRLLPFLTQMKLEVQGTALTLVTWQEEAGFLVSAAPHPSPPLPPQMTSPRETAAFLAVRWSPLLGTAALTAGWEAAPGARGPGPEARGASCAPGAVSHGEETPARHALLQPEPARTAARLLALVVMAGPQLVLLPGDFSSAESEWWVLCSPFAKTKDFFLLRLH